MIKRYYTHLECLETAHNPGGINIIKGKLYSVTRIDSFGIYWFIDEDGVNQWTRFTRSQNKHFCLVHGPKTLMYQFLNSK